MQEETRVKNILNEKKDAQRQKAQEKQRKEDKKDWAEKYNKIGMSREEHLAKAKAKERADELSGIQEAKKHYKEVEAHLAEKQTKA